MNPRGLVTSPTVEVGNFVRGARSAIRARLKMAQHTSVLTFYDPLGTERPKLGWRTDGSPLLRVEWREIPLG